MLFSFKLLLCCMFFGGRKTKRKKGKFNFRIPKFLFHDYGWMFYGSESVSVCAGVWVSQNVLGQKVFTRKNLRTFELFGSFRCDKVKLKWVRDKKEVVRGLMGGSFEVFLGIFRMFGKLFKKVQRNLFVSSVQTSRQFFL